MIGMGVDAMPNIKKVAIETAKTLKERIGADNMQQYFEDVLNNDIDIDNEESKEEEKNKKMITKIMSNITEKKKVVREKPNFKAFV
jgi:DNA-directed RNA polymerase sigma subunit (sigma70/sigma32)